MMEADTGAGFEGALIDDAMARDVVLDDETARNYNLESGLGGIIKDDEMVGFSNRDGQASSENGDNSSQQRGAVLDDDNLLIDDNSDII